MSGLDGLNKVPARRGHHSPLGLGESVLASVWQAVIVIYCQLAPCCVDRLRPPPFTRHS
jgi:hypothetical protein